MMHEQGREKLERLRSVDEQQRSQVERRLYRVVGFDAADGDDGGTAGGGDVEHGAAYWAARLREAEACHRAYNRGMELKWRREQRADAFLHDSPPPRAVALRPEEAEGKAEGKGAALYERGVAWQKSRERRRATAEEARDAATDALALRTVAREKLPRERLLQKALHWRRVARRRRDERFANAGWRDVATPGAAAAAAAELAPCSPLALESHTWSSSLRRSEPGEGGPTRPSAVSPPTPPRPLSPRETRVVERLSTTDTQSSPSTRRAGDALGPPRLSFLERAERPPDGAAQWHGGPVAFGRGNCARSVSIDASSPQPRRASASSASSASSPLRPRGSAAVVAAGGIEVTRAQGFALRDASSLRERGTALASGVATSGESDGESELVDVRQQLKDALRRNAVRVIDLFREWDEDGDGTVSKMEFRKAMPMLGLQVPREEVDKLFDEWDPGGSGDIDMGELNKLLRQDAADTAAGPADRMRLRGFGREAEREAKGSGTARKKSRPRPAASAAAAPTAADEEEEPDGEEPSGGGGGDCSTGAADTSGVALVVSSIVDPFDDFRAAARRKPRGTSPLPI